jgi:histidine triad (HIT) family protein
MVYMQDSIFTKIIKGEIPCHKIYEDDKTFAFLDIHPVRPGHVLVVPKKQVEFIWDLESEDYHALMETTQKLGTRLRLLMSDPYVSMRVVGVDVPHTHVHLIPFMEASQLLRIPDMSAEPDHDALAAIAEMLTV